MKNNKVIAAWELVMLIATSILGFVAGIYLVVNTMSTEKGLFLFSGIILIIISVSAFLYLCKKWQKNPDYYKKIIMKCSLKEFLEADGSEIIKNKSKANKICQR